MGALADLALLSPTGLFGLLALAVPVIIHIISRSRGRRVLVGNIGLLRALHQQRARAPRLERWLLLLIRLLLLALAALVLARLALPGLDDLRGDAVYLTKGWLQTVEPTQREAVLSAGGGDRPTETRELEDGDVWPQLAERLAATRHTGRVDVYTSGRSDEFGAHQPRWPGAVRWHRPKVSLAPAELPRPLALVVYDPGHAREANRVEAALAALQRHRLPGLTWTAQAYEATGPGTDEIGGADWLLWLAEAPAPETEAPGSPRRLTVNDAGWPGNSDDPGFPEALLDALLTPEERAATWGHAPVDTIPWTGSGWMNRVTEEPAAAPQRPYRVIQPWLALAMIILWALERWLSEGRRRA